MDGWIAFIRVSYQFVMYIQDYIAYMNGRTDPANNGLVRRPTIKLKT